MEYLSLLEVQSRSVAIADALETLIKTKAVANKPNAKQWRFLRDCVHCLLSPGVESEFHDLTPVQAAQLKFEVEDRLKRYYLRPGKTIDIVFSVVHVTALVAPGMPERNGYPSLAGYAVLIRDVSSERRSTQETPAELKPYLERVITEGLDAEFRAYSLLPKINEEELRRWFSVDGSAMKGIMTIVTRHQKKGWVISNPLNPSTKRLLDVKVKKITDGEAVVNTMEHWYLRWFDMNSGSFAYTYRETNRQTYIIKKESDGWKIFQNLRPSPRTSLPHRWKKRQ
jgi:hypothetical protein